MALINKYIVILTQVITMKVIGWNGGLKKEIAAISGSISKECIELVKLNLYLIGKEVE